jgi:hypothetical protein
MVSARRGVLLRKHFDSQVQFTSLHKITNHESQVGVYHQSSGILSQSPKKLNARQHQIMLAATVDRAAIPSRLSQSNKSEEVG